MLAAFFVGLAAAASNATSNVLQRGAHLDAQAEADEKHKFSLRFLLGVARRPRWLLGIVTMVLSFILQAIGLGISSLAVIQPILVLELPLTLMAAGIFIKEELTNREWLGSALMFCGVVIFVVMLDPSPGRAVEIGTFDSVGAILVTLIVVAGIFYLSFKVNRRAKTALLGIASGVGFGLTAIVIKDMTTRIGAHGMLSIFTGWQLYMIGAFGLMSVYLFQYALASGRLMYSQPGVTLADPFVAIIWGIAVFNESTRGGIYLALAIVGVLLTAAGVFILARSPLLKYLDD